MIQAALGAFILLGLYKFMNTKSDYEIDKMMAFIFILVPCLLIFLLTLGLGYFEISTSYALFGYLLYFIFPFLFLKLGLEFQARPAFNFAIVVPVVAILTEIPFAILLSSANA